MGYSCAFVDTRSGQRLFEVEPAGGSWKTLLNAVGESRIGFSPRDAADAVPSSVWRDVTQTWHRTLVVSYDGVAVHAGLVVGSDWSPSSGALTVRTQEVRALAARRYAAMLVTYDKIGKFTATGKSLRGLVRAILGAAFYRVPGDNWTLPFVLGGDESGPHSREWWHHEFDSFEDMLSEVQDTDGGPDLALNPVWSSSGVLQWWPQIGAPRVPGAAFEWNVSAPQSPVTGFATRVDGSRQLSGIFTIGEGSGQELKVGRSPLTGITGPPIPDMDGTRSFTTVKDQALLDARAAAEIRAFRSPTTTHSFGLRMGDPDHPIDLSTFRLGARPRIWHDGDEILDAGWRNGYVTALSGDVSSTALGVEVQTI